MLPTPLSPGRCTVPELVVVLALGTVAVLAVGGCSPALDATTGATTAQLVGLTETALVAGSSDGTPPTDGTLVDSAVEGGDGLLATDALAGVPWTQVTAAAAPDAVSGSQEEELVTARTAFGSMWVWDNSLTAEQDNRGTGYASADPQTIVDFARDHGLNRVHVAAPWVSDEGPIAAWMDATTAGLHEAGFEVGVLGGDPGWFDDPSLAVTWTLDAISTRSVDYVALSLEPWTLPSWTSDRAGSVARWEATMDAVKAALPAGVGLALDAPYWLVTTPAPDGGTLFDAVLERADSLAIVTFVDHADAFDGIIALSAQARAAAGAAGIPYTVGLETDTPEVAGGAPFTFYDDGADALVREAGLVGDALADDPLFEGIAVEHYRAWRSLLGLS